MHMFVCVCEHACVHVHACVHFMVKATYSLAKYEAGHNEFRLTKFDMGQNSLWLNLILSSNIRKWTWAI